MISIMCGGRIRIRKRSFLSGLWKRREKIVFLYLDLEMAKWVIGSNRDVNGARQARIVLTRYLFCWINLSPVPAPYPGGYLLPIL